MTDFSEKNLNNSMCDGGDSPLAVEHARVMQALLSVRQIIRDAQGFADHKDNRKTFQVATETLNLIAALQNTALKIIRDTIDEEK